MGKIKGIPFEDVHKRVSFLYQAAHESLKRNADDLSLCRFYVNTLMVIARRQGLKLHPDIKRKLCKRCCLLLLPGVTAIYRVKKKRQKQTVLTCLGCGTLKRFVYSCKTVQWLDRPEAWMDVVSCGQSIAVPKSCNSGNPQQADGTKKSRKEMKREAKEASEAKLHVHSDTKPSVKGPVKKNDNKPSKITEIQTDILPGT